jgi:recombination protein RecT
MELTPQTQRKELTGIKKVSEYLNSDSIKNKFSEILGEKGIGFISSVLSVCNSNKSLQNADTASIYTAALMAATLDLPINPNLGFAYIVPYNESFQDAQGKWQKRQVAQFQMGYKGFIQLSQRSGQFEIINSTDVREGELLNYDRMSGEMTFNWDQNNTTRLSKKIIGYVSYFKLHNGFRNSLYMTTEEVEAHAKEYSQTYKLHNKGLWKDKFSAMALKTVTKLNLSKNAPLSIELKRAVLSDQAVIKSDSFVNNENTLEIEPEYIDNQEIPKEVTVADKKEAIKEKKAAAAKATENPKTETIVPADAIEDAVIDDTDFFEKVTASTTLPELEALRTLMPKDDLDLEIAYSDKKRELSAKPTELFDAKGMA